MLGVVIALVGVVLLMVGRVPWLGRLPGDLIIERGGSTFYFPLTTCILISVIISLVLYFFRR